MNEHVLLTKRAMEHIQALDHCEIYHQIAQEIKDFDNKHKKLANLLYWSGNAEHINNLGLRILGVLLEHNVIEECYRQKCTDHIYYRPMKDVDCDQLRGVLFFLILNSDNEYHCTFEELCQFNPQCVQLLEEGRPLIPKFVTISIAYRCGLNQFFEEFLACGPYWLTAQYYDSCNETLSHISNPADRLIIVGETLRAGSEALAYYAMRGGPGVVESDWIAANSNLKSYLAKILQRHVLNAHGQLRAMNQSARKVYLGDATCSLLEVVIATMNTVQSEGKKNIPDYVKIYVLRTPHRAISSQSYDVLPVLNDFIGVVLDALEALLHHVTIDTYMEWHDIKSGQLLLTLQEYICGLSMKVVNYMETNDKLRSHSIKFHLSQMSKNITPLEERISDITLGELLSILDDQEDIIPQDEERLIAIGELFKRNIAFGNEECVSVIINQVPFLNESHAVIIFNHLNSVIEAKLADDNEDIDSCNSEYNNLLMNVVLPIFKKCCSSKKVELLNLCDQLQLRRYFSFEPPGYEEKRISYINKITFLNASLNEILNYCFTNPKATWVALSHLAVAHENFGNLFWSLVRKTVPHATNYMSDVIKSLLNNDRMIMNNNGRSFLIELYNYYVQINSSSRTNPAAKIHDKFGKNMEASSFPLRLVELSPIILEYKANEFKKFQGDFLTTLGMNLKVYVDAENFTIVKELLILLTEITKTDLFVFLNSRKQLKKMQRNLNCAAESPGTVREEQLEKLRVDLKAAKNYQRMHKKRIQWRQHSWPFTSHMLLALDGLRWNLRNFSEDRIEILGMAVSYVNKNLPNVLAMNPEFLKKFNKLINELKYKAFWRENLPDLTLSFAKSAQQNSYVELLLQSSAEEAKALFAKAMESYTSKSIMDQISTTVTAANSNTARNAYYFLYRIYISTYQQYYIPSNISDKCVGFKEGLLDVILKSPPGTLDEIMHLSLEVIKELYDTADPPTRVKISNYIPFIPQNQFSKSLMDWITTASQSHDVNDSDTS